MCRDSSIHPAGCLQPQQGMRAELGMVPQGPRALSVVALDTCACMLSDCT